MEEATTPITTLAAPTGPNTAHDVYGPLPSAQPLTNDVPVHRPGEPEPMVRTLPPPGAAGLLGNPTVVLVGLLALAVILVNVTISGSVRVQA